MTIIKILLQLPAGYKLGTAPSMEYETSSPLWLLKI